MGTKIGFFLQKIIQKDVRNINLLDIMTKFKCQKNPMRNYHLESEIFNVKPDKSKTLESIRRYHNSSNVFVNNEPKNSGKAIRTYHLESDILFTTGNNQKEKKAIRGVKFNYETMNDPQKKGKIRRILGKELNRTNEEIVPISKKMLNIKMSQILIMV